MTRHLRNGQHWTHLPLVPDVVADLRVSFRDLPPELDDHVFAVEVAQWGVAVRASAPPEGSKTAGERADAVAHGRAGLPAGRRTAASAASRIANRLRRESGGDVAALGG